MGVFAYRDEYSSPILQVMEGPAALGSSTSKKARYKAKFIKTRINAIDPENFSYTDSLIEGDGLSDKVESIVYGVQFVPQVYGSSMNKKIKSTYHTKGDFELNEEEVKAGKEASLAMYKVVEDYLQQNPDAYA